MEKREDRRDRTWRRAHARQLVWLTTVIGDRFDPDARGAGYFRKHGSVSCRCRRKKLGRPKIARGLCHGAGYQYHESVQTRIEGRRLCRRWLGWVGTDLDDLEL